MLNPKVSEIFTKQTELEVARRQEDFQTALSAIISDFNKRGVLRSSMCSQALARTYRREYDDFCQVAWGILHRAAVTIGVQPEDGLADRLCDLFRGVAIPEAERLHQQMIDNRFISDLMGLADRLRAEFLEMAAQSRDRIVAEIDLFVSSAELATGGIGQPSQPVTVYAYAPVGIIQTGAHSTGTVTQNIDAIGSSQLQEALSKLRQAIEELGASSLVPSAELIETIDETRTEIDKPSQNVTRIRGLLLGLGATVQTTAALRPAYDVLKAAASAVGISLP